ncbi:soluble scavenger receptor cysteine-rich domain-containing protein SSC5D-like isoform X2 [Argopecten irradians]|uniref:soluble scavenger receptor cysteine-rich domain-containing protein SSC5D-like isoform X2 n=1 Tax=Argopecten irradians TaxID=31199 RepID=UPI003710EA61
MIFPTCYVILMLTIVNAVYSARDKRHYWALWNGHHHESGGHNTATHTCNKGQFTCHNHRCISVTSVCNGRNDCHDNSDEHNCPVAHSGTCIPFLQFKCQNKHCVPFYYLCNGHNDCGDNSDEKGTVCATHVTNNHQTLTHVTAAPKPTSTSQAGHVHHQHGHVTTTTKAPVVTHSGHVHHQHGHVTTTTKAPVVTHSGNFKVRLVHGRNAMEGRVEIKYNGVWGTVCDDAWDDKDAGVICGMLGYDPHTASHTSKARFGSGTGPIWLDETQCSGRETSIQQCQFVQIGHGDCDHSEDAGVICQPTPSPTTTTTTKPTTTTTQTSQTTAGGKWVVFG